MPLNTTDRVTLNVAGQAFAKWTRVRIVRDMHEICGSFELEYVDEGRLARTLTDLISPPPYFQAIEAGMPVQLLIDNEPVLVGHIRKVLLRQTADSMTASISGLDVCGDLVECAASPTGQSEWSGITMDQFARAIAGPYGIGVSVQTDVGAPFTRLALSPHEKAMSALEKASRQRSVLVVSDGVGNVVLTTAGSTRSPAPIAFGQNVVGAEFEDDWTHRFSDVYVKGQSEKAAGRHKGVRATMTPATKAGAAAVPSADATTTEKAGIVMTGHAQDPEITRYRPAVFLVKTQSGMSSVQQQAEWHVRVLRGEALRVTYTVQDWRAGASSSLWRPNALSAVYDPYAGIDDDMLIAGVEYLYDQDGSRTALRMVGKTAYDRVNESARRRPRHAGKTAPTAYDPSSSDE